MPFGRYICLGGGGCGLPGVVIVGCQHQFRIVGNIELGARLQYLARLEWAAAAIGKQDLNIAFYGRDDDGFVDDLGAHIHCSRVTDLDAYTLDARSSGFSCKNVQH
ncbi:hypothetical protein D3C75_719550 [compost metagenome]